MKQSGSMLKVFLYILAADVILGTAGFAYVEDLSWMEAFYFTVVTITTVGYGDIAPVTNPGRFMAGVLIITGVAAFTGVVATITERLVIAKEEAFRKEKIGIVVSVFFSEIGNDLIRRLIDYDVNADMIRETLSIEASWDEKRINDAIERLRGMEHKIRLRREALAALLDFIEARTETLLRMLENPNLHKDSSLTDLLRAVLHFKDELQHRHDFGSIPDSDVAHLSGDAARAYGMLIMQWAVYLKHIKSNYPYLYSLALRINAFRKDVSAVVQS